MGGKATADGHDADGVDAIAIDATERAADQALALRRTVDRLRDPGLEAMVDLVLLELGRRLARDP